MKEFANDLERNKALIGVNQSLADLREKLATEGITPENHHEFDRDFAKIADFWGILKDEYKYLLD